MECKNFGILLKHVSDHLSVLFHLHDFDLKWKLFYNFENTLVSTAKDVRELGTTQKIMSVEIMPGFRWQTSWLKQLKTD